MPVPTWEHTISDQPRLAPSDYAKLDPCVPQKPKADWHNNRYIGSGFLVSDLIPGVWWYQETRRCGHCQSRKTLCIYLLNDVHQFSTNVTLEIVCLHCEKYTQYEGSD